MEPHGGPDVPPPGGKPWQEPWRGRGRDLRAPPGERYSRSRDAGPYRGVGRPMHPGSRHGPMDPYAPQHPWPGGPGPGYPHQPPPPAYGGYPYGGMPPGPGYLPPGPHPQGYGQPPPVYPGYGPPPAYPPKPNYADAAAEYPPGAETTPSVPPIPRPAPPPGSPPPSLKQAPPSPPSEAELPNATPSPPGPPPPALPPSTNQQQNAPDSIGTNATTATGTGTLSAITPPAPGDVPASVGSEGSALPAPAPPAAQADTQAKRPVAKPIALKANKSFQFLAKKPAGVRSTGASDASNKTSGKASSSKAADLPGSSGTVQASSVEQGLTTAADDQPASVTGGLDEQQPTRAAPQPDGAAAAVSAPPAGPVATQPPGAEPGPPASDNQHTQGPGTAAPTAAQAPPAAAPPKRDRKRWGDPLPVDPVQSANLSAVPQLPRPPSPPASAASIQQSLQTAIQVLSGTQAVQPPAGVGPAWGGANVPPANAGWVGGGAAYGVGHSGGGVAPESRQVGHSRRTSSSGGSDWHKGRRGRSSSYSSSRSRSKSRRRSSRSSSSSGSDLRRKCRSRSRSGGRRQQRRTGSRGRGHSWSRSRSRSRGGRRRSRSRTRDRYDRDRRGDYSEGGDVDGRRSGQRHRDGQQRQGHGEWQRYGRDRWEDRRDLRNHDRSKPSSPHDNYRSSWQGRSRHHSSYGGSRSDHDAPLSPRDSHSPSPIRPPPAPAHDPYKAASTSDHYTSLESHDRPPLYGGGKTLVDQHRTNQGLHPAARQPPRPPAVAPSKQPLPAVNKEEVQAFDVSLMDWFEKTDSIYFPGKEAGAPVDLENLLNVMFKSLAVEFPVTKGFAPDPDDAQEITWEMIHQPTRSDDAGDSPTERLDPDLASPARDMNKNMVGDIPITYVGRAEAKDPRPKAWANPDHVVNPKLAFVYIPALCHRIQMPMLTVQQQQLYEQSVQDIFKTGVVFEPPPAVDDSSKAKPVPKPRASELPRDPLKALSHLVARSHQQMSEMQPGVAEWWLVEVRGTKPEHSQALYSLQQLKDMQLPPHALIRRQGDGLVLPVTVLAGEALPTIKQLQWQGGTELPPAPQQKLGLLEAVRAGDVPGVDNILQLDSSQHHAFMVSQAEALHASQEPVPVQGQAAGASKEIGAVVGVRVAQPRKQAGVRAVGGGAQRAAAASKVEQTLDRVLKAGSGKDLQPFEKMMDLFKHHTSVTADVHHSKQVQADGAAQHQPGGLIQLPTAAAAARKLHASSSDGKLGRVPSQQQQSAGGRLTSAASVGGAAGHVGAGASAWDSTSRGVWTTPAGRQVWGSKPPLHHGAYLRVKLAEEVATHVTGLVRSVILSAVDEWVGSEFEKKQKKQKTSHPGGPPDATQPHASNHLQSPGADPATQQPAGNSSAPNHLPTSASKASGPAPTVRNGPARDASPPPRYLDDERDEIGESLELFEQRARARPARVGSGHDQGHGIRSTTPTPHPDNHHGSKGHGSKQGSGAGDAPAGAAAHRSASTDAGLTPPKGGRPAKDRSSTPPAVAVTPGKSGSRSQPPSATAQPAAEQGTPPARVSQSGAAAAAAVVAPEQQGQQGGVIPGVTPKHTTPFAAVAHVHEADAHHDQPAVGADPEQATAVAASGSVPELPDSAMGLPKGSDDTEAPAGRGRGRRGGPGSRGGRGGRGRSGQPPRSAARGDGAGIERSGSARRSGRKRKGSESDEHESESDAESQGDGAGDAAQQQSQPQPMDEAGSQPAGPAEPGKPPPASKVDVQGQSVQGPSATAGEGIAQAAPVDAMQAAVVAGVDSAEIQAALAEEQKREASLLAAFKDVLIKLVDKLKKLFRDELDRPVVDIFPDIAEDYLEKVKHPMDLGTIKANLERGVYPVSREGCDQVFAHLQLVGDNMVQYQNSSEDGPNQKYLKLAQRYHERVQQQGDGEKAWALIQQEVNIGLGSQRRGSRRI